MEITKDRTEEIFRQNVHNTISREKSITIKSALSLMIDFFSNYKIRQVDITIPDNDMLLFEYGVYDWQDGKDENFTIDIVRQFYIENENNESEGFSQLHLILYFDSNKFGNIIPENKWSADFDNIEGWKNFVTNMEGFRKTEEESAKAFDIFLTETE